MIPEWSRTIPAWRKMQVLHDLNWAVQAMALSGMCARFSDAMPEWPRRQRADLALGPGLAEKAYGLHEN